MESKYNFSAGQWQNTDVAAWTQESYGLAKSNVYAGVTDGKALSDAYVSKNVDAIQRAVVLGGLRLAYVIQHIFGGAALDSSFLQ